MTRTMTEHKKIFTFGKIDYNGSGRKNCEVTVQVYLKETDKGLVFSAMGNIWNTRKTDCYSCGQNLDTIAEYVKAPLFKKIYTYWKKYHLNDMNPDCIHQRELKWSDIRIDPKELPNASSNRDEKGLLASWIYEKDHPKGFLMKACPVCGYKYGSAWLFEPIPTEDLNDIKALLEIT